jgi:hypothetical protein
MTAALAALAVPALIVSTAAAGPASASSIFNIHISPNNTFALVLDVSGASTQPGAPVIDWWQNGGSNQGWTFVPNGSGPNIYEIINDNSGQCLTTDGVAGDQVFQDPCSSSLLQLWHTPLNPSSAESWAIQNVGSLLFLDVSGDNAWPGASIDTWTWNGGSNQLFVAL